MVQLQPRLEALNFENESSSLKAKRGEASCLQIIAFLPKASTYKMDGRWSDEDKVGSEPRDSRNGCARKSGSGLSYTPYPSAWPLRLEFRDHDTTAWQAAITRPRNIRNLSVARLLFFRTNDNLTITICNSTMIITLIHFYIAQKVFLKQ